jgi:hypothetical protein
MAKKIPAPTGNQWSSTEWAILVRNIIRKWREHVERIDEIISHIEFWIMVHVNKEL